MRVSPMFIVKTSDNTVSFYILTLQGIPTIDDAYEWYI